MSKKRYFSDEIMMSDAFLEMSGNAVKLYIALNYHADCDGVVNNRNAVTRSINVEQSAFEELIAKNFIIDFEDLSVCVIKHWWIHNTKRGDRYRPTNYPEVMNRIVKKDNMAYTLATKWQPNGNQMATNRSRKSFNSSNSNSNSIKTYEQKREVTSLPLVDDPIKNVKNDTNDTTANDTTKNAPRNVASLFDEFWKAYPNKKGKDKCDRWFASRKISDELFADIVLGLERDKKSEQWQKDNGQYIPYPYTWLNQGRWKDGEIKVKPNDELVESESIDAMIEKIERAKEASIRAWLKEELDKEKLEVQEVKTPEPVVVKRKLDDDELF